MKRQDGIICNHLCKCRVRTCSVCIICVHVISREDRVKTVYSMCVFRGDRLVCLPRRVQSGLPNSFIERLASASASCSAGTAAIGTGLDANWFKSIGYHRTAGSLTRIRDTHLWFAAKHPGPRSETLRSTRGQSVEVLKNTGGKRGTRLGSRGQRGSTQRHASPGPLTWVFISKKFIG